MKLGVFNAVLLIVFGVIFIGQIAALSEHQIAGIDGLRCDSCGQECSVVCGSRQFRTCCYNYIKKRSDPGVIPANLKGQGSDDTSVHFTSPGAKRQSRLEDAQSHLKGLFASRFGGRHLALDSQSDPLTYDPEDLRWFPYVAGDIYNRLEEDVRTPPSSRFRLF